MDHVSIGWKDLQVLICVILYWHYKLDLNTHALITRRSELDFVSPAKIKSNVVRKSKKKPADKAEAVETDEDGETANKSKLKANVVMQLKKKPDDNTETGENSENDQIDFEPEEDAETDEEETANNSDCNLMNKLVFSFKKTRKEKLRDDIPQNDIELMLDENAGSFRCIFCTRMFATRAEKAKHVKVRL